MHCTACAALAPEIRCHPFPGCVAAPARWGRLGSLICERCGARCAARTLTDTLMGLEDAGLGVAGPLLRAVHRAALPPFPTRP